MKETFDKKAKRRIPCEIAQKVQKVLPSFVHLIILLPFIIDAQMVSPDPADNKEISLASFSLHWEIGTWILASIGHQKLGVSSQRPAPAPVISVTRITSESINYWKS